LREVRIVSRLRHPHIVPIKNAEIIDGYPVVATDLSVGTLYDCSKPMGPRRIISIMSQVLDGLAYAHQKRVVHCDVTPGNIFLFSDGQAAVGDFGIGLNVKGRMETIDDFGTPGYVAPEQAYGRPTYRSDCFSTGLILYEYITGMLPRWPFKWPFRGNERLAQRTNAAFAKFMKKSLSVDPAARYANARQMLTALRHATPKALKINSPAGLVHRAKPDWRHLRREAFVRRYRKVLAVIHQCVRCGEPISESMIICPWCGSSENSFADRTILTHVCRRCHRGISPRWSYCPWCYGAGFEPHEVDKPVRIRYHGRCGECGGPIMRFMRYCPWCRAKIRKQWRVWPFPEVCGRCGWSVDSGFWNYCPWCKQKLTQ
jgi:serine/threonine-protein kinase